MRKRPTKKQRTLLIDGDIVLYQQAYSNEHHINWGNDVETELTFPQKAASGTVDYIKWIQSLLHASDVLVMVTGGLNFRKDLNPDYKSNRKAEKPKLLSYTIDALNTAFNVISEPRLEADDLLGIYSTDKTLVKGERIIVSIDKDMRSIPCLLFNPMHYNRGVIKVSPQDAERWFYTQCMIGDPIDGYHGVPKIGKVKAEKLLSVAEAEGVPFWNVVYGTYIAAGLTMEDALRNARMAYILKSGDYDFKRKEVKLWQPPK